MINISAHISDKPTFESLKNRRPILEYSVSLFNQFDFTNWESEEHIRLVRVKKNNVENAEEFLRNTMVLLRRKSIDIGNLQKITNAEFNERLKDIIQHFRYDLNVSEGFEDAVKLSDEWNQKDILLETDNEFIYIEWGTSA